MIVGASATLLLLIAVQPAASLRPTLAHVRARVATPRAAPCVLLAKKKKKAKKSGGGPPPSPSQSPMPAAQSAAPTEQLMTVTVPDGMGPGQPLQVQTPAGIMQVTIPDGCGPGAAFEMLLPTAPAVAPMPAAPPPAAPPSPAMDLPLMTTPPPSDALLPPDVAGAAASDSSIGSSSSFASDDDDEPLPALEPLELDLDETKVALPSFDEYKKGPSKPMPTKKSYESKLPSINQGRSPYDDLPQDDKTPLEKLVFGLAWGGIFFLVAVEIFVNTPFFSETAKPAILKFLADE